MNSKTDIVPAETGSELGQMMRLAVEQGEAGVSALERLMAMKERDEDRAAVRAFAQSMREVQAVGVTVVKDRHNEQTRSDYATYSAIARALKPVYTECGFSLMFGEGVAAKDGDIRVIVDVMHESGHIVQRYVDLPPDKTGIKGNVNKTDIHAKGSALSYGERYLTVMVFCPDAVNRDDDGNAAGAGPVISDKQAADLYAMIEEVGGADDREKTLASFLKWAGYEAIEDLPAARYQRYVDAIEARRRGK